MLYRQLVSTNRISNYYTKQNFDFSAVLMMLNNSNIKFAHLERIRTLMSSAAPLGAADIERFHEKSKGKVNFLQMYGMTEASPLILCQTDQLKGGVKIGGSGILLPNTKAKIVDANDSTNTCLESHKSGELLIKGPQVFRYLDRDVRFQ